MCTSVHVYVSVWVSVYVYVGWGGVIAANWIALDSKWRGREGEKWAVIVHEAKEIGRD